jgi:hypothetical protein
VLDPRVIHQDVDAAQLRVRVVDHDADLVRLRHVRQAVSRELLLQLREHRRLAEAVDHDPRAGLHERAGDAEPDAAGGSRDDCPLALEHVASRKSRF